MKKNKSVIFKYSIIMFFVLIMPILIIVSTLYANDGYLLQQFNLWVKEPGNLTAFIVAIGAYFPLVNGIWKLILNIWSTINMHKAKIRSKDNKIKLYDDNKGNYLYWDEMNSIIDFQLKAPIPGLPLDKMLNMTFVELKHFFAEYNKTMNKK